MELRDLIGREMAENRALIFLSMISTDLEIWK
jgi:hypothetical protein